jgi:histone H3/H4
MLSAAGISPTQIKPTICPPGVTVSQTCFNGRHQSLQLQRRRKSQQQSRPGGGVAGCKKRGTVAAKEIRKLQQSTELLIPKAPFARLVKEVLSQYSDDFRCALEALLALQTASESYLTALFEDVALCCIHAGRATITIKDLHIARRLRESI